MECGGLTPPFVGMAGRVGIGEAKAGRLSGGAGGVRMAGRVRARSKAASSRAQSKALARGVLVGGE